MGTYYVSEYGKRASSLCDCSSCDCPTGATTDSCPADDVTGGSTVIQSGQFTLQLRVLSIDAFGIAGWSFGLDYLRNNDIDDLLGPGFNYSQNIHLSQATNGDVLLVTHENTVERFVPMGGGRYSSTGNNTRAILTEGENEFSLLSSSGVTSLFHNFASPTPGRMKKVTDRYGSTQELTWESVDGVSQLTSVTDGYGRAILYRYYGPENGHQLREIEDFLGRKVKFQYDEARRLVALVTPSILKAAEGNTFPGGTAYVFQYDAGNPRPERRNDLVRIWYPNEATPFIDAATRTVDVAAVYAQAKPRYVVEYGQDPTDEDHYGLVTYETVGDPNGGVGGTYSFVYTTDPMQLPSNLIDPTDLIAHRTVVTDRNGNQVVYDFNEAGMTVRKEVMRTRSKLDVPDLTPPLLDSYVTWTKYNGHNQPVVVVYPEGNSVEHEYDDGTVDEWSGKYTRRIGLRRSETHKPGNTINIPSRSGSSGQTELTRRYFYDPLFARRCAVVERRGNPIAEGPTYYYPPQNGGNTPTDSDRHRYATISYFDYQKDTEDTVKADTALQELLGLSSEQIGQLIDHVQDEMATMFPAGYCFDMGLEDINGDGTGEGAGKDATHSGNVVKIKHPSVRQLVENPGYPGSGDPWQWVDQSREELFTTNARGQTTTHTDPEGTLTVYVRYPYNDPEGDGQFVSDALTRRQYGRLREVHVDADPQDVMSLVGVDGDLVDFVQDVFPRNLRTGDYLDLVTRYQGIPGGVGCSSCGYDALGNVLSQTDPRGFTTTYDRNELGEAYRVTSPVPYNYRQETYYDANRNVVRVDVEDKVVAFASEDPAGADYAKFMPTGSGYTAHVPTKAGAGGAIRPGWFTNLSAYDLLDNKVRDDIDATGSTPQRLVTTYQHDPNQNLVKITKPAGNVVEYDYDERDLRIATRVGYLANLEPGAVSISVYDGNGNLIDQIGPLDRRGGAGPTTLTAVMEDAFRSGQPMTHTGTWVVQNTLDGFDRTTEATDAIGNVTEYSHDPDGRVVQTTQKGPAGGDSPTDRSGTDNVDLAKSYSYFDEAGRAYEAQQDVFLNTGKDEGQPTHNLLSDRTVTHTGGGLAQNSTTDSHIGMVTLTTGGESYVLTRNVFDRAGRLIALATDNAAVTHYEYDGAGRQTKLIYPKVTRHQDGDPVLREVGSVEMTYDANGNLTRTTWIDKPAIDDPPAGLVEQEVFESFACHDAMNRLVLSASQGADGSLETDLAQICAWPLETQTLVTRHGYDSRGNRTLVIDPKGNTSLTVFDGASRSVETIQHLRQDGGGGPPEPNTTFLADGGATVRTVSKYDANGRLSELIDDRGGTTLYTYDSLDRQFAVTFHDGSTRTTFYNAASDVVEYTDENGSAFTNTYDAIGRLTQTDIAGAIGTYGLSQTQFRYDGLSRRTRAYSQASPGDTHCIDLPQDSFGRLVEQHRADSWGALETYVTQHAFLSLVPGGLTYPNGRQIAYANDQLYRRVKITDADESMIAAWSFVGPSRVAELNLGNGLVCTYMNNARTRTAVQHPAAPNPQWGTAASDRLGYDGAGRMIAKRYLDGELDPEDNSYLDATPKVGFTTGYDHASNKLYERHLHAENRSHLYPAQDSLDRLRQYQRGTLQQDVQTGQVTVQMPISLPGTDEDRAYALDGLGNWRRTASTPAGGSQTTEVRQHNSVNQLTRMGTTPILYDHGNNAADPDPDVARRGNGNVADDGTRAYAYNAVNRIHRCWRSGQELLAGFDYDALGSMIEKDVTSTLAGGPTGFWKFFHFLAQCVQEVFTTGGQAVSRQYVWGLYVDELIQQKELSGEAPPTYYPLSDLLYRTTALTDADQSIVETYDYDAYGRTIIFTDHGTGGDWWADDAVTLWDQSTPRHAPLCRYLFTGREFEAELSDANSQIYYYRARRYSPQLGRFLQRDPLDYLDGANLYRYCRLNPAVRVDPSGLWWPGDHEKLTEASFDVFPAKADKRCREKALDIVKKGNTLQDSSYSSDLRRHYNRGMKEEPKDAQKAYDAYISEEARNFEYDVSRVNQVPEGQRWTVCENALWTLGKLTHAWQDYFAHAVLVGGDPVAWSIGISGTPDKRNEKLIPSSWQDWVNDPGEHGRREPADRDLDIDVLGVWSQIPQVPQPAPTAWPVITVNGRQRRWDGATSFVRDKYKTALANWHEACWCYCLPPRPRPLSETPYVVMPVPF